MKFKKFFAISLLSFAALVALGAAALFLANSSDAELNPAVSANVAVASSLSPDEERAAQLVGELKSVSANEPKICRSRNWCPRSDILKPEIAVHLKQNVTVLAAYHDLLKHPYYIVDPKSFGRGIFNFLKVSILERREWNRRLATSTDASVTTSVAAEMQDLNRFLPRRLVAHRPSLKLRSSS